MSGIHLCLEFNQSIEKNQLKCETIYVSLLYFELSAVESWPPKGRIGHSDEPKSLLPAFGQNQHKINASGSKFYEIKEKQFLHTQK